MLQPSAPAGLDPVLKDTVDIAEKLLGMLALTAAGLFTYFKIVKERIYRPRLEPRVGAELVSNGEQRFLKVRVTVKNTGLSQVDILLEPSRLRVFGAAGISASLADEPSWESIAILDVAERHEWIDPQQVAEQTWLVSIPPQCDYPAFRAEFRLVGLWSEWLADDVVVASDNRNQAGAHRRNINDQIRNAK